MLFINGTKQICGVYQYGKRIIDILKNAMELEYKEVETQDEFIHAITMHNSSPVVINYHSALFPWISTKYDVELYEHVNYYYILHEGSLPPWVHPSQILNTDPSSDYGIPLPRPLYISPNAISKHKDLLCPVIGSFGFGFENKNFPKIISLVQEQFDKAIIHLHIAFSYYSDSEGHLANSISQKCREIIYKPGIEFVVTNHFMTNEELSIFLSSNDLNIFLYDESQGRGCSSVLDHALGVDTPVALSPSCMFRHVYDTSICAYHRPLKDIISDGTQYIQRFKKIWSHEQLVKTFLQLY